jgi:hypothetical protein
MSLNKATNYITNPYRKQMNKILMFLLFMSIGLVSCNNSEKGIDKLEIAKLYYKALDNSNSSEMKVLLADSLITAIPEYDYELTYSKDEYVEKWLKWDSIFDPSYEILEIEEQDEIVLAKISKIDKRIFFLQKEPFITNEILRFQKDKIIAVETAYLNFNEKVWESNKTSLLSWIGENHPELNGFIYDQTKPGGLKYLKAIELYKNRN